MMTPPTPPVEAPPEQELPSGKKYTVEALQRAHSEVKFESSLAQVLFQAWFEENLSIHEGDVSMPKVEVGIDKCMRIAVEFRKRIHSMEFEKREEYDKSIRARYQRDGKTLLHLPDAGLVAPHLPPGSIVGLD